MKSHVLHTVWCQIAGDAAIQRSRIWPTQYNSIELTCAVNSALPLFGGGAKRRACVNEATQVEHPERGNDRCFRILRRWWSIPPPLSFHGVSHYPHHFAESPTHLTIPLRAANIMHLSSQMRETVKTSFCVLWLSGTSAVCIPWICLSITSAEGSFTPT